MGSESPEPKRILQMSAKIDCLTKIYESTNAINQEVLAKGKKENINCLPQKDTRNPMTRQNKTENSGNTKIL